VIDIIALISAGAYITEAVARSEKADGKTYLYQLFCRICCCLEPVIYTKGTT
jgi:hypothetical protein